jgi:hypothetical protein
MTPRQTDTPTTDADELATRLVEDRDLDARVRHAVEALAAWRAFPPIVRRGFPREARRLARRAAVALLAVIEVRRHQEPAS